MTTESSITFVLVTLLSNTKDSHNKAKAVHMFSIWFKYVLCIESSTGTGLVAFKKIQNESDNKAKVS